MAEMVKSAPNMCSTTVSPTVCSWTKEGPLPSLEMHSAPRRINGSETTAAVPDTPPIPRLTGPRLVRVQAQVAVTRPDPEQL